MPTVRVILTTLGGEVLDTFDAHPFKDRSNTDVQLAAAIRDKLEMHFEVPEEE